jgi:hypothetical protein
VDNSFEAANKSVIMIGKRMRTRLLILLLFFVAMSSWSADSQSGFVALFPKDGVPEGWSVRAWDDVSNKPKEETVWKVEKGVLNGGEPRGSWLVSDKEYGDFIIEFEFKLGERGNSGCGVRFPARGDPAFDGMEIQMADFRYNTEAKDSELTGGIYRAIPPRKQVYKPTEWNNYQITLKGDHIKVVLNDEVIQDLNLAEQSQEVKRHNGESAPPVKDRPRKGHIGFQELSRGGAHVLIRNAWIKVLD